jgi:hypothetical protein
MNLIKCNVITMSEIHIATIYAKSMPQIGDRIWINKNFEQKSYEVLDFCHWFADNQEFHEGTIYVDSIK